VYCPYCRTEFPPGFKECTECHVLLLTGASPVPATKAWERPPDLVVVFETNDPEQLASATKLLEDEGIPFYALGQLADPEKSVDPSLSKWPSLRSFPARSMISYMSRRPLPTSPSHWIQLQVPRDQQIPARNLLSRFH
jgi:hypothetical protein